MTPKEAQAALIALRKIVGPQGLCAGCPVAERTGSPGCDGTGDNLFHLTSAGAAQSVNADEFVRDEDIGS